MMQIYKKQLIDSFSKQIKRDFIAFCQRQELPKTTDTFLDFLIDKELIGKVAIRKYTVNNDFKKLSESSDKTKTQIVKRLGEKYHLSERTVWNTIKAGQL